jgi:hypothetical protein
MEAIQFAMTNIATIIGYAALGYVAIVAAIHWALLRSNRLAV